MPLSCHPCINIGECEFLGGLFQHLVEKRTNIKKGITKKHVMLQHVKDWMLIEINRYAKPTKCQHKMHMGYDGKNKDAINPNGKHQSCLCM